jgi:hypothetical protein
MSEPFDKHARQTAALIVFPQGVSEQEARQTLERILKANAPRWNVSIQTKSFNPSINGVTIYQP